MIKTQELKTQIDELTKQNDMMLAELERMKQLISGGGGTQSDASGGQAGRRQNNQQGSQQGSQQARQSGAQKGGQSSGGDSSGQTAQLANELLQIKDMVAKLEQKTSQYVSGNTNGSLTEKDVVNLVLTLINGMVDWSSEYISSQSQGSGQMQ